MSNTITDIIREGYRAYMNDLKTGVGTKCPYTENYASAEAWREGYYLAIDEMDDGA